MRSLKLGTTELRAGELGFGAMYLPRISVRDSDTLLHRAIDRGIRYFDTAAAYQDSEEKLGRVLPSAGDDIIVASRSMAFKMDFNAFEKEFYQSVDRLKRPVIDFYGFHAINQPDELKLAMGRPLEFLQQQQSRGIIRHIAITGHNPATLTDAVKSGAFAMVMFPFNIIEQEALDGLLDTALERGVATSIMKPLAGGVIGSKALALRFLFEHPVGIVTPGMSSVKELEENLQVFEQRTPLTDGEMQQLREETDILGKEFCRRCSYCMPCPNGIMIPFVHMIHMKCYEKPIDDDVAYTLQLGMRLLPALEQCDGCGSCVEKCPYNIPTPKRVKELMALLKKSSTTM